MKERITFLRRGGGAMLLLLLPTHTTDDPIVYVRGVKNVLCLCMKMMIMMMMMSKLKILERKDATKYLLFLKNPSVLLVGGN